VKQVVYQYNRSVKGFDGFNLVAYLGIHRILFNYEAVQCRREHFLCVQGFGNCVRYRNASEYLAERHAHIFAQNSFFELAVRHAVDICNYIDNPLVHKLRVKRKHQSARIYLCKGSLHFLVGFFQDFLHFRTFVKRFFERGVHIFNYHHRLFHINLIDTAAPAAYADFHKALPLQRRNNILLRFPVKRMIYGIHQFLFKSL